MSAPAIIFMCIALGVIWGGLGVSIAYLLTHPMKDASAESANAPASAKAR